jgi:hypothetical protein
MPAIRRVSRATGPWAVRKVKTSFRTRVSCQIAQRLHGTSTVSNALAITKPRHNQERHSTFRSANVNTRNAVQRGGSGPAAGVGTSLEDPSGVVSGAAFWFLKGSEIGPTLSGAEKSAEFVFGDQFQISVLELTRRRVDLHQRGDGFAGQTQRFRGRKHRLIKYPRLACGRGVILPTQRRF